MRVRAPKLFPGIHKFTSNGFDVHRMDVWKWKMYMKICEKYKHMFDFGLYWLAILILQVFKFTCFIIGLRVPPPNVFTLWYHMEQSLVKKLRRFFMKTTESWEKDWSRLLIIQSWKVGDQNASTYILLSLYSATQVWFCEAWRGEMIEPHGKILDVKGRDGCYNSYWSWAPRKTTKNGARCVEMKFWSSYHGFSMNITSIGWWWMMNPPFDI